MNRIPQRFEQIQARLLDHLVSVPHPCADTDEQFTRLHHQDLWELTDEELRTEDLRVDLRLALDPSPDLWPDRWLRERRAAVKLHLRRRFE